jgi:HPt (histidine-containing phosphotransfer) domain-containing protein
MEIPLKLKQNYVRRRQEDIISCETALKNSDFKTIETIGHQMKGNGLSFGFESIAKLGEQMETAARSRNVGELSILLGKFSEVVAQITPEEGR